MCEAIAFEKEYEDQSLKEALRTGAREALPVERPEGEWTGVFSIWLSNRDFLQGSTEPQNAQQDTDPTQTPDSN
jgi:hypothetical protein